MKTMPRVHVGNVHGLGRPAYGAIERLWHRLDTPDPMVTTSDIADQLQHLVDKWPEADPPPANVTNALGMLTCVPSDPTGAFMALSLVLYG